MMKWIKEQPKQFSHFTRRLDKKLKKYFTLVDNFMELYNKYITNLAEEGISAMSLSSFRFYFKKYCRKSIGFKKNHLDVCSTCLKLYNLKDKVINRPILLAKLKMLQDKHLLEADSRYKKWRKDKFQANRGLIKEENECCEHSKY